MATQVVRVHAISTGSMVNGPGSRAVVWYQGCSLGCVGCFNPGTHEAEGPLSTVEMLIEDLVARDPMAEGLTVSGGEPLQQQAALAELIDAWTRRTGTGVIVLTGYRWEEIDGDPSRRSAVSGADLVIAGRYNARLHLGSGLRGSGNKTYHFLTDRYLLADVMDVPEFEAVVGRDGTVHVSGVAGSEALRDALDAP